MKVGQIFVLDYVSNAFLCWYRACGHEDEGTV